METLNNINKLSDEDLVKGIVKDNNTLLFEILYDRYAGLVYNKCYGFAKDGDEALGEKQEGEEEEVGEYVTKELNVPSE